MYIKKKKKNIFNFLGLNARKRGKEIHSCGDPDKF